MQPHDERQAWFYSDLVKLREVVFGPVLTPADMRTVVAATLRRHFVDSELSIVAHEMGLRLKIRVPDTSPTVAAIRAHGDVLYWQLARAKIAGNLVHSLLVAVTRRSGQKPPDLDFASQGPDVMVDLKPNQFQEQKIAFSSGLFVTRREIVKFFANKLGGVHADPRRSDDLERALERMRGELNLPLANGYQLDGLQVELIAMAQSYLQSPDIEALFGSLHEKFDGHTH